MTKICHISTAHPTFDGRIFHKECVSLSKAGYDVTLVVTHPKDERVDGVNIKGLKKPNGRFERILIKPWKALFVALKTKAVVFHFHDPELMFVGVILKILGKKVVFDSHENVSHQIETKEWLGNKTIRSMVKSLYRLMEKFNILFYDKVISVTPEIVEFLSPKKGVLIRNYPKSLSWTTDIVEKNEKVTTFIYAGGLSMIRGIKEICVAVDKHENPNIELVLLGPWESEAYRQECLTDTTKVKYLGLKTNEEVFEIMKKSDVGFVNFHYEKNHMICLPTKSFEYMNCKLPMIMSDIPYWHEMFGKFSNFVNPTSNEDLVKAIDWMVDNKEKRTEMGRLGNVAVNNLYSWEAEAKTLIKMYDELVGK